MAEYHISCTEDRLTLRRTRVSAIRRGAYALVGSLFALWLIPLDLVSPTDFAARSHGVQFALLACWTLLAVIWFVALYLNVLRNWLVVFDRKTNTIWVDGRSVFSLGDVSRVDGQRQKYPVWLPRCLVDYDLELSLMDGRKYAIYNAIGVRRNIAELKALNASISEILPGR